MRLRDVDQGRCRRTAGTGSERWSESGDADGPGRAASGRDEQGDRKTSACVAELAIPSDATDDYAVRQQHPTICKLSSHIDMHTHAGRLQHTS